MGRAEARVAVERGDPHQGGEPLVRERDQSARAPRLEQGAGQNRVVRGGPVHQ
jgi:hypothetical protein